MYLHIKYHIISYYVDLQKKYDIVKMSTLNIFHGQNN